MAKDKLDLLLERANNGQLTIEDMALLLETTEKKKSQDAKEFVADVAKYEEEIEIEKDTISTWEHNEIAKIKAEAIEKRRRRIPALQDKRKEAIAAARRAGVKILSDPNRTKKGYISEKWDVTYDKKHADVEFRFDGEKVARITARGFLEDGIDNDMSSVMEQISLHRGENGKNPWSDSSTSQHRRTLEKLAVELMESKPVTV